MAISAGIIGATGYTGSELVRLLHTHPEVNIAFITSERYQGQRFSDVHPQFTSIVDIELISTSAALVSGADVFFLALPHGVSMKFVQQLKGQTARIIDLSGDYRLSAPAVYEKWYEKVHEYPEAFDQSVYGMPELHREAIQKARLVANPGCYPTASILALAPLIAEEIVHLESLIIDAKSGITGAGAKARDGSHFPNANDNFSAYKLKSHRHTVEIEEQLCGLTENPVTVQFTPHLLPVDRGILATVYAHPTKAVTDLELKEIFRKFYSNAPFIRIRETPPTIKDVRASNYADIYMTYDERTHRIIVLSAIDNLVKGAAGQAVHNMNLMFDLEESLGLNHSPLRP